MQINKIFILLVWVFYGLPLLAAADSVRFHPVTGEKLAPPEEQVLNFPIIAELEAIDPHMVTDSLGFWLANDLFEGLMVQDQYGEAAPGIATHYDLDKETATYTFYLRDGLVWSNGEPLTAKDMEYSWQRAVAPATGSPYS